MSNYNLQELDLEKPSRGIFAAKYSPPLWYYTVLPRVPEDTPYIARLDFSTGDLNLFVNYWAPSDGDVLEIFQLNKRVLVTGLQVKVLTPVLGLVVKPVTNSLIKFDSVDCSERKVATLAVGGGDLNRTVNVEEQSKLVAMPDFLGIQILQGSASLEELSIEVQLVVSDSYKFDASPNYVVN